MTSEQASLTTRLGEELMRLADLHTLDLAGAHRRSLHHLTAPLARWALHQGSALLYDTSWQLAISSCWRLLCLAKLLEDVTSQLQQAVQNLLAIMLRVEAK